MIAEWQDQAACRGIPNVMFPLDGLEEDRHRTGARRPSPEQLVAYDRARAVCAGCTVVAECSVGMEADPYGVRAGTAPFERCARLPTRADKLRERLAEADDGRDAYEVAATVGVTPRTVWRHRQLRLGA